ncbi:MAG: cardiolipin synthase [Bryobacteraceae bacterium]|nr:cardiolipin synthase [Bryobacteraceae bacterium]
MSGSAPRPTQTRSRPPRRARPAEWRQINFPQRGLYKLSPNPQKPRRRRALELWDRVRLFVRSATVWALLATWCFASGRNVLGGGLAALAAVLALFRPHSKPIRCVLEHDFGTDSAEFLSTVAGATGVPMLAGNRVSIYNNGDEFYPAMLEAIRNAELSITMEQYIFVAGSIGREFAEAFAERARAGVRVKLLVDAVGSSGIGREILDTLRDAGCELAWFRPIQWFTLHRANNRNHRKSVIIDGRVAFTGGAGIDDHWLGSARGPGEWRDVQIRIEGPGVTPLQTGFAVNWLETTGEVLAGPRYFPVLDARRGIEVQTVLSSPKGDVYSASILYSLSILCARQCIYITNPYFVPGGQTLDMLADAVDRGVDVKVIVAGAHNDTWWARMNSIRLYGKLLEAGVKIYEYQPSMLHQKTMVVDDLWATVGTTNFDQRSFRLNEESNVCFYDPDLVAELKRTFEDDMAQSRIVTIEDWQRRGFWSRAGEHIASLVQDQV